MADHNPPKRVLRRLRQWARRIKRDGLTLWFAVRHADTPMAVKLLGAFVVAYALSPIDLIPDFIPVVGYLDDVLLLPGLIWIAIRLLPPEVLQDCRVQADAFIASGAGKPVSKVGAVIAVSIWAVAVWFAWAWWRGQSPRFGPCNNALGSVRRPDFVADTPRANTKSSDPSARWNVGRNVGRNETRAAKARVC